MLATVNTGFRSRPRSSVSDITGSGMIGPQIETILGLFGDLIYARDEQQRLWGTSLAAIPQPDLLPEQEADETKWTIRRKLSHALLRPATLVWTRQPDWSDELADAQLRADCLNRWEVAGQPTKLRLRCERYFLFCLFSRFATPSSPCWWRSFGFFPLRGLW